MGSGQSQMVAQAVRQRQPRFDRDLDLMRPNQTLAALTARLLAAFCAKLTRDQDFTP